MPYCFSLFDGRITVFGQTVHLFWIEVSKTGKINTINFKIQSVCRRWSQRRVCKSEWRRLSVSWRSLILLLKECHGSLLLLKQHPVTDPKPLTKELIKLMCDTPPPPWYTQYSLIHFYLWLVQLSKFASSQTLITYSLIILFLFIQCRWFWKCC